MVHNLVGRASELTNRFSGFSTLDSACHGGFRLWKGQKPLKTVSRLNWPKVPSMNRGVNEMSQLQDPALRAG